MGISTGAEGKNPTPYRVIGHSTLQTPLIFTSPHSGEIYPCDFLAASNLPLISLKRSADSFVDRIFAAAPVHGAPLLYATYARAYLDLNREPWELDPQMFEETLPSHINSTSLRVVGGLGTIPRLAADGQQIYSSKLSFVEAQSRLKQIYFPYHRCLSQMLAKRHSAFGYCLLIDCHSMPSKGNYTSDNNNVDTDKSFQRADIVLGDRFGTACAPELISCAHNTLSALGLRVQRNNPYAGGFTTYHYGRPAAGVHALQIEINRRLYMDENQIIALPGLADIKKAMTALILALKRLPADNFTVRQAAE